jgi:hypothetical protein
LEKAELGVHDVLRMQYRASLPELIAELFEEKDGVVLGEKLEELLAFGVGEGLDGDDCGFELTSVRDRFWAGASLLLPRVVVLLLWDVRHYIGCRSGQVDRRLRVRLVWCR